MDLKLDPNAGRSWFYQVQQSHFRKCYFLLGPRVQVSPCSQMDAQNKSSLAAQGSFKACIAFEVLENT